MEIIACLHLKSLVNSSRSGVHQIVSIRVSRSELVTLGQEHQRSLKTDKVQSDSHLVKVLSEASIYPELSWNHSRSEPRPIEADYTARHVERSGGMVSPHRTGRVFGLARRVQSFSLMV